MPDSALSPLQRLRIRVSAPGILISGVIIAIAVVLAWIGTGQPNSARLELVAFDATGQFAGTLDVPATLIGDNPRYPLVLAMRNRGETAAAPDSLFLSVPFRFRLVDRSGRPLPSRYAPGSPLARYAIPLEPRAVQPGTRPGLLPGVDTLWIAPWLPDYYCVQGPAGVPEFVPAPAYDPVLLADVHVYYEFHTNRDPRQTGLVRLRLDPGPLRSRPGPIPPLFPTERIGPDAPLPELPALFEVGERTEPCGDPDQALTIRSVLWQSPDGGRVIALHQDSAARKRLYDLNRDSIVELVVWDADGDGVFDTRRQAQFPIPRWLMPRVQIALDSVAPDSAALPDSLRPARGGFGADTLGAGRLLGNAVRTDTIRNDTIGPDPAHWWPTDRGATWSM